jgi:hypothetical protein
MARKVCEIVSVEEEGGKAVRNVVGTFVLDGGRITYSASPGNDRMMQNLLQTPATLQDAKIKVTAAETPALWFQRLPWTFGGSYLYARPICTMPA